MTERGSARWSRRWGLLVPGAFVACLALLAIGPASGIAFPSVGGEVVIIQDVSVRSPVLSTHDKCMGYVDHGLPVVPVTVKASFITPGGQPTGPYGGILEWSGGFGSEDDHFGSAQGHSPVQFFHVLARAAPSYYHGAGEYSFLAFAQDVGLAGGFAIKEKTVTLPGPPPSGAGAEVKCTIAGPNGLNELLSNIATAGLEQVGEQICGFCFGAKNALENISYYNELTNDWLGNAMVDDPPDANFQQIAQPQEPPVIPPPTGLSAAQQAAVVNLEQQYAHDIGLARALETTVDRVWGADNGASRYWHVKQMQALSAYAAELADDLGDYQALYDSLESALAPDLPDFSITEGDALRSIVKRSEGFSAQAQQTLSELGATPREEEKMINDAISVDPGRMVRSDGVSALFSQDEAALAAPMRAFSQWAAEAVKVQPPVVSDVTPRTLPPGGGTMVKIKGTNLSSVTGINFGPSTPFAGEGTGTDCFSDTECWSYAPPGHGTVDVVAVGPGGPSETGDADQVTYQDPTRPEITHVFPSEGAKSGGTSVSISGEGLSEGVVYFGPTPAMNWSCTDTHCTAQAPASASNRTVDVQVAAAGGTSAASPVDHFEYVEALPPPVQPRVTAVSPSTGTASGGDTVTISGSHFTAASDVEFGTDPAESFEVVDDSHIRAVTPATYEAETVDVTVTGPGGASAINSPADRFSFDKQPPVITSISPTSGSDLGGAHFTIEGSHLGNGSSTNVSIGEEDAFDTECSQTRCEGTIPPGQDGRADVAVSNFDGEDTLAGAFTYEHGPAPTIAKVTPDTGLLGGGDDVVITGSDLQTGEVEFGDQGTEGTCTPTVCVAKAPAADRTGRVDIRVTTNAGKSAPTESDEYAYVRLARPVVRSVIPAKGFTSGYAAVVITGNDLTDGTVKFGTAEAQEAQCTATYCKVRSPEAASPGPVDVTVTTLSGASETSSADTFDYVVPRVAGVSPSQGWTLGGTDVTITGTDLGGSAEDPEEESISFGGKYVTGTCEETTCTATSPEAPANTSATVDVRVRPPLAEESEPAPAARFSYVPRPAPAVAAVSPATGTDRGGDRVTITGTDLGGGTVKFGDRQVAATCDPTTCTATSPQSDVGDQPVDVTVTTPTLGSSLTSAASAADQFTFQAPGAPAITAVSPDHGSVVGGTPVTIEGDHLTNSVIHFGGVQAGGVSCQRTGCTASAPKAAGAGAVHVTATTSSGTSATSAADQFTYEIPPAPVVSEVIPDEGPASGYSTVTVTGTDLAGGAVSFGGHSATSSTCTETACTAISPASSPGAVDVTVATPGGTSATSSADQFRFSPVTLTEHAIPGVNAATGGGQLVRGVGGDIWFTMPSLDQIGRIAADGSITTFPTLDAHAKPFGITVGPDGKMWYSEENPGKLVSVDSGGNQTGYQLPGGTADLRYVTGGPDGRLWFTLAESGTIGAMTTGGDVTLYHLPNPSVLPYNILPGPDGRLWFTEVYGHDIGAITTDGSVSEYRIPDAAGTWGLAVGADNRLWFGEWNNHAVGAVTTSGKVTSFPAPAAGDDPQGVISGADGRIWFGAPDSDFVSALDPSTGEVQNYPLPGPEANGQANEAPRYLAMDAEGTLWVTENQGKHVLSVSGIPASVAPTVTGISPNHGGSGTAVTIGGTNLGGASTVKFGSTAATFTVDDPAHITATAPAGSGTVHVTVRTPNGTSATAPEDRFNYGGAIAAQPAVTEVSPASGPLGGGTAVTVTGSDLSGASVKFGATAASGVSCTETSCTATSPAAAAAGPVDVTATTSGGTSEASEADRFVYLAPPPPRPTITGVSPSSGNDVGGSPVTITGTHLREPTVSFGLEQAAEVTCSSETSCTAVAPASGAGEVDLRVTTGGGTSARTAADHFTYLATHKTPTTLTLTLSPDATTTDGYSAFTAHVSPAVGGTVQFYLDGVPSGGPAPVSYGYGGTTLNNPPEGAHQVRAVFTPSDGGFYATSSDEATLTVEPGEGGSGEEEGEGGGEEEGEGEPGGDPPVNVTPPSVSGQAIEGSTLTATAGTWQNSPTDYLYEWEDCDAAGDQCESIEEYAHTHTLTAADVGHSLRVLVYASNDGGFGEPAQSAPTGVVQASGSGSGGGGPGPGTTSSSPQPGSAPPQGPGASTGAPSSSQIVAALKQAMKVSGKAAKIGELLKHRGYAVSFAAPSGGRLAIAWYGTPAAGHGKPFLVGALKASFPRAGTSRAKLLLTAKGRKLLAHVKRLRLTVKADFTPAGGAAVNASGSVSLKR